MYSEFSELPTFVLTAAQVILSLSMCLCVFRIWKGPGIMDRVVALDLIATLIMGQCILFVIESGFTAYLDVATAIAIISFLATVAFARCLENEKVPE